MNIIFAGTSEFALPSLEALLTSDAHEVLAVYTQPDRPAGRGRRLSMSPVKELALKYQRAICQPLTLRDISEQKRLMDWQAELMVVVSYGLILPPAVLTMPFYGCVNVHASLLPRWRGAAPLQRAILAGDRKTGVTIMQMDKGLDTGKIFKKVSCDIGLEDTYQTLQARVARLGAQTLLESLETIAKGSSVLTPQNDEGCCYAKKIDKAELKIDWNKSASELDRVVRAFYPKPMARIIVKGHSDLGQTMLLICKAKVLSREETLAKPGVILRADSEGIDVATAKGILRLLEIQWPGGRCLPVSSFIHRKLALFHVGSMLV